MNQYRRDKHLHGARALLTEWQSEKCWTVYRRRPWGPQALLPDDVLGKFASRGHAKTVEDLLHAGWSPTHTVRHGTELLAMLADYDTMFKADQAAVRKRQMEEKKAETMKHQKLKKDADKLEHVRLKAIKNAQPKPPRKSRAKPKGGQTLQPSMSVNVADWYSTPSRITHSNSATHPVTPRPSFPFVSSPFSQNTAAGPGYIQTPGPWLHLPTPLRLESGLPAPDFGLSPSHFSNLGRPEYDYEDFPSHTPTPWQVGSSMPPPSAAEIDQPMLFFGDVDMLAAAPTYYYGSSSSRTQLTPQSFYGHRLPAPFLPGHYSTPSHTH